MSDGLPLIRPDWPAPRRVRAVATTRVGGVSRPPYEALNLGLAGGDDPQAVAENRRRLAAAAGLPADPRWLGQVHGTAVVRAEAVAEGVVADAAVTAAPGVVCGVLTADCLPVVLAGREGDCVGVAHAGWRGLAAGVLEATAAALGGAPGGLIAWLGPAIGPDAFEVGDEVYQAFTADDVAAAGAFRRTEGRWHADLYLLARQRLARAGVQAVYGGGWCTYSDPQRFFSYRRDGETGRMATVAWLEPRPGEA